jgi:hypothetical protein
LLLFETERGRHEGRRRHRKNHCER